MSNKALVVGALVLGYMYIKQNGGLPVAAPKGVVAVPGSLPGSVGSGWQQVATGALAGLLQGVVNAPRNNTSVTTIPSNYDWYDRSGNVQEAVMDMPTSFDDLVGGDRYAIGWA